MKNILKIFKHDIKDILTNIPLLLVTISLCILPSLYAWFNIKSSWDPYGNTGNIKVAIVNNDKGSEVFDNKVDIGKKLLDKLKDNKSLGWEFVDKKTAIDGVNNGTYYASLEIPENFSTDLTSLVGSDVKKGEIIYTVNEKINAIAPKITDKGASSIQLQVNETVVKTVSEIIFEVFNGIGVELENQLPKLTNLENSLVEIKSKFSTIEKTINLADETSIKVNDLIKDLQKNMPLISETLKNSVDLSKEISNFLGSTKNSVDKISPIIKNDLILVSDISNSASTISSNIKDTIKNGAELTPDLINSLSSKVNNLKSISQAVEGLLSKINQLVPSHPLDNVLSKINSSVNKLDIASTSLESINNKIESGSKTSVETLDKVSTILNDVKNVSNNLINNFDSQLKVPISNIFNESMSIANGVIEILNNAQSKLPMVEDLLNTTLNLSNSANESVSFIKQKMPKAKQVVNDLVDTIHKINNNEDIGNILDILKSDVISRSNFLERPVEISTEKLYPSPNYGASMTPFYTVLSLWVGIMLLVSLLSATVHGCYKPFEVYFGRGLTFLTISIIQGLVVSIGNIYILDVKVVNPALFITLSLFISIVFTLIVYSLVSIFGNVGKAIGIVIMVIQVAGSGGTFPVQVTPEFFQVVNPLLPFTYAINSLREATFGIYMPNLQKDLFVLFAFLFSSIIFSLLLKPYINKLIAGFTEKFNESDLTGH